MGKSHIEEVNELISIHIPASKEYDTLSGYVLYKIGRIPEEKETLFLDDFDITVKSIEANRIISFIVKKKPETPLTEDETPRSCNTR